MSYAYSPAPSCAPAPAFAYAPPAIDDDDRAILVEAQQGQIAVDGREQIARPSNGELGRQAWAAVTGEHSAERVRTYSVRTLDGLVWTYLQPYSALRQMPGEHRFILHGALPHALQVIPPAMQWRRPRFWWLMGCATLFLLFFYGLGLFVPPLCILLFRPWARFTSPDPGLAVWVGAQPHVKARISATKFGWLGLLGSGGWRLPWVVQLYSLGNGRSQLVIKAPDVGRWSLTRYRVGFQNAAAIARAFQAILPIGSTAPPQQPLGDGSR